MPTFWGNVRADKVTNAWQCQASQTTPSTDATKPQNEISAAGDFAGLSLATEGGHNLVVLADSPMPSAGGNCIRINGTIPPRHEKTMTNASIPVLAWETWSMSFWFILENEADTAAGIELFATSDSVLTEGFCLVINNNGSNDRLAFKYDDGGTTYQYFPSIAEDVVADTWYFVGITASDNGDSTSAVTLYSSKENDPLSAPSKGTPFNVDNLADGPLEISHLRFGYGNTQASTPECCFYDIRTWGPTGTTASPVQGVELRESEMACVAEDENPCANCWLRGTLVELFDGREIPIEELRPGDTLVNQEGRAEKVLFVQATSHSKAELRRPKGWKMVPTRVRAHAFGEGCPARDVWLSRHHNLELPDGRRTNTKKILLGRAYRDVRGGIDDPRSSYEHETWEFYHVVLQDPEAYVWISGMLCEGLSHKARCLCRSALDAIDVAHPPIEIHEIE